MLLFKRHWTGLCLAWWMPVFTARGMQRKTVNTEIQKNELQIITRSDHGMDQTKTTPNQKLSI